MRDDCVARRLLALRLECGKSQQLVADFCGISQAALSRYECGGRVPGGLALLRLAAFYGVGVEALLPSADELDDVG